MQLQEILTLEEVYQSGMINLELELPQIYPNITPQSFINQVTDYVLIELQSNHYCGYSDNLSEHQLKWLKKGIIYQMMWFIENGDLANDSGIRDSMVIDLSKAVFSPFALKCFKNGGLANIPRG